MSDSTPMSQNAETKGAKSLEAMSVNQTLRLLSKSIQDHKTTATFACGGAIPIITIPKDGIQDEDKARQPSKPSILDPVVLHWDSAEPKDPSTLTFPLSNAFKLTLPLQPTEQPLLDQLIKDCQPATFGRDGKAVFDETYRKAQKLDASQFTTNFNPYECGIIDTIGQLLLPSLVATQGLQLRGIRAELYKLNIYSGPSGKFHEHVDTPRSETQFASLVVCLPHSHTGGELLVRHEKNTVEFDWGAADVVNANIVQWAAFYSDCEHEVLEVHSGHRITLTYNLFVSEASGLMAGQSTSLIPQQLPLYSLVQGLLCQPGFMRKGGRLGIHLSHSYAHTHQKAIDFLPHSLKGVDMAMYEVFRALDFKTSVKPVYQSNRDHNYSEDDEELRDVGDVVGSRFVDHQIGGYFDEENGDRMHLDYLPHKVISNIVWLTKGKHLEPSSTAAAYGNEPSLTTTYSYAALLVTIPPYSKRPNVPAGSLPIEIPSDEDTKSNKENTQIFDETSGAFEEEDIEEDGSADDDMNEEEEGTESQLQEEYLKFKAQNAAASAKSRDY